MTKNFTLKELTRSATAERNGIDNTPPPWQQERLKDLCRNILQPIRDRWGKAIYVTSGYRCPLLNKLVGGVKNSQHLDGEAADIVCEDNIALWKLIKEMERNGEIRPGQVLDEHHLRWIHISLPRYNKNIT